VEIFVDFGLFEILAVTGLASLGKAIYRRPFAKWAVLFLSIAAPAALLFLASGEVLRWTAALALGTSLINVVALIGLTRAPASGVERVEPGPTLLHTDHKRP
jgi:hypothetical protein